MSKIINTAEKTRLQKVNLSLGYNIVGTMLPFIISLCFVVLFSFYADILAIISRGDLLLYSAGLYTAAILSFMNNKRNLRLTDRRMYHISYLLILISSLLFAGNVLRESIQNYYKVSIRINIGVIWISSIILLSTAILFLKRALDYEIETPTAHDLAADDVARSDKIAEEL